MRRAIGYRRAALTNLILLAVYSVISLTDLWSTFTARHVSGEVFPFFNWDLFSSPRQQGRLYTVRVTQVASDQSRAVSYLGRTLADPHQVPFLRDSRFQKTARALARAHRAGRDSERARMQLMLENFFEPDGIREYDLVFFTYHPLSYYAGREEPEETVVATFTVGGS